jgi:hypothetical protein
MALTSTRAKWRSSLNEWSSVGKKVLDNAGIVRDPAIFRQCHSFCRNRFGYGAILLAIPCARSCKILHLANRADLK